MSDTKTYEGSCHCGAVRIEVQMAPPDKAFSCNCSICSRIGWLLAFVPREATKVVSGQDNLSDYQFAKQHIHHFFCKTCGVRAFSQGTGPGGKEMTAVNLRCIQGLDATELPVQKFDGASI